MSVIVKGMEMPKNCTGCPICCGLPYQHRDEKGRRPDCPLVELPPHGRLGDLDVLTEDLAIYRGGHSEGWGYDGGMYEAYNNSLMLVEDAPTVIEAEGSET